MSNNYTPSIVSSEVLNISKLNSIIGTLKQLGGLHANAMSGIPRMYGNNISFSTIRVNSQVYMQLTFNDNIIFNDGIYAPQTGSNLNIATLGIVPQGTVLQSSVPITNLSNCAYAWDVKPQYTITTETDPILHTTGYYVTVSAFVDKVQYYNLSNPAPNPLIQGMTGTCLRMVLVYNASGGIAYSGVISRNDLRGYYAILSMFQVARNRTILTPININTYLLPDEEVSELWILDQMLNNLDSESQAGAQIAQLTPIYNSQQVTVICPLSNNNYQSLMPLDIIILPDISTASINCKIKYLFECIANPTGLSTSISNNNVYPLVTIAVPNLVPANVYYVYSSGQYITVSATAKMQSIPQLSVIEDCTLIANIPNTASAVTNPIYFNGTQINMDLSRAYDGNSQYMIISSFAKGTITCVAVVGELIHYSPQESYLDFSPFFLPMTEPTIANYFTGVSKIYINNVKILQTLCFDRTTMSQWSFGNNLIFIVNTELSLMNNGTPNPVINTLTRAYFKNATANQAVAIMVQFTMSINPNANPF